MKKMMKEDRSLYCQNCEEVIDPKLVYSSQKVSWGYRPNYVTTDPWIFDNEPEEPDIPSDAHVLWRTEEILDVNGPSAKWRITKHYHLPFKEKTRPAMKIVEAKMELEAIAHGA